MKWTAPWVLFGLLALALAAGCAPRTIVLTPGAVPMTEGLDRVEGPAEWSFWVAEARDVRAPEKAGQRVGTLYTRFEKSPQSAFLDRNPEVYVQEQLSRYLLHRGLEASGPQTAKVLLAVELEEFAVAEDPGSMWDELTVRVAYTVRYSDRSGRELGRVRVEGTAAVKSPADTIGKAEQALRGALADTFQALYRSPLTERVLQDLGGEAF